MQFIVNPFTGLLDAVGTSGGPPPTPITITGDTGGAQFGPGFVFTGGVSGLSFTGTPNKETITGILNVAHGGTGVASITSHSLIVGASTSPVTLLGVAANGQLPIGSNGADPVLANITSTGGTITITNGAGSINLDIAGGSAAIEQFLPDSGTSPVVPDGTGAVTMAGSGSITTVGGTNTLTFELTGLTNHAVLVGAGTTTITKVGPTATAGQVLQSAGVAADPVFSTATYPSTTTINQILYSSANNVVDQISASIDGVLITSHTGVPSLLANSGTPGWVLTANSGAPPSWQATAASSISITGDSGGALTGNAFTFTGGTTGLTFAGSVSTETLGGTLVLANGGTNANLTASNGGIFYSTASAGAILSGTATARQMLQSGSSTAPAWSTSTWPATTTANQILYSSSTSVVGEITGANNGVLITSNAGVPSLLANSGTPGWVLTANAGAPPSWQAGGASGITIAGDSGTTTGNSFTFTGGSSGADYAMVTGTMTTTFNYLAIPNTTNSSPVGTITLGGNTFLSNYGNSNTFIGEFSGNNTLTVGMATDNTALGAGALGSLTTGSGNTCGGSNAGGVLDAGTSNSLWGAESGSSITSGTNNSVCGEDCLVHLTTGGFNFILGQGAGNAYTSSETNNIIVGRTDGTVGESNVTRIGFVSANASVQTKCFIDGIASVSVSNQLPVVIDSSTGQLGTSTGSLASWTDQSGAFNAAAANGYFITNTSTSTLPASPNEGDTISFIVDTTNILTIQANTGQKIRVGTAISASAGTSVNNARGDSMTLVYRSTGTTWFSLGPPQGTWTTT